MGTDIELTVLFSDVVGSTRIYEVLGDQRAREVIALCIDLMQSAVEKHRGGLPERLDGFLDQDRRAGRQQRAGRRRGEPGKSGPGKSAHEEGRAQRARRD